MDAMADTLRELSPMARLGLQILWTVVLLVIILVVGLVLARVLRQGTTGLLRRVRLDEALARVGLEWTDRQGRRRSYAEILGTAVYALVVVLMVVAAFEVLDLEMLAGPLNAMISKLAEALPNLLKAFLILGGAWILALVLKVIVERVLSTVGFDRWARRIEEKESEDLEADEVVEEPGEARRLPSQVVGLITFYLVLLLALPAFLEALRLDALVSPLEEMLTRVFAFIPDLVGAALIFLVGWIIARLLRTIVGEGLSVLGVDEGARRLGLAEILGEIRVSQMAATVVFYAALFVALVTAVETLGLEAISRPVTTMFTTVVDYVPALLGAGLVVAVGVVLGRLVRRFVTDLLTRLGFDGILARLGLGRLEERAEGAASPSRIVGVAAMVVVVLLFAAEALDLMRLSVLSDLFGQLLAWLPRLVVAVLIVGVGLAVGRWVRELVSGGARAAGADSPPGGRTGRWLGEAARAAVLVFAFAMALTQMGIGQDVVLQGFTVLFAAVCFGTALAAALAFGLAGRGQAEKALRRWTDEDETEA